MNPDDRIALDLAERSDGSSAAGYRARNQYVGDVALHYDEIRQRTLYDRWKWRREHAAVGRALADLGPVESVLDLPTGTGRFLRQLGARAPGARTVGADISLGMLAIASRHLTGEHASTSPSTLVGAEAERLPFADGTFDLVLSIRFFQHLPVGAVGPILAELCRVSRRGVVLQVPLAQRLSPIVRPVARWLLRTASGGRLGFPVARERTRFFPASPNDFEALLAGLGLRVHSYRAVTWRGGQLRLVHVAP